MEDLLKSDSQAHLAAFIGSEICRQHQSELVETEEKFWCWGGKIWDSIDEKTIKNMIVDLDGNPVIKGLDPKTGEAKTKPLRVTSSLVDGTVSLMRVKYGHGQNDFFKSAPFGLQFNNGFLTLNKGAGLQLLPSDSSWRQRILMPWDWNLETVAPRWEQALDEWFEPGEPDEETNYDLEQDALQKRMFLQEFTGACLMGVATNYAKATILTGRGENGKSKFIEALSGAFPPEAWSCIEPQSFGEEYQAAHLAGKRINFSADIPSTELVSSHVFKAAVTGDPIMARHIRQSPFQFKPEAGHIFSANELPPTRDYSHGFWRRFVVIEFANSFSGQKGDPDLSKKLRDETPGIITWMVKGALRLLQQGHYTIPLSAQALLESWKTDSDVVARWAKECTEPVTDFTLGTTPSALFQHFDTWRAQRRYKDITDRIFYRRLKDLVGKTSRRKYARHHLIRLI